MKKKIILAVIAILLISFSILGYKQYTYAKSLQSRLGGNYDNTLRYYELHLEMWNKMILNKNSFKNIDLKTMNTKLNDFCMMSAILPSPSNDLDVCFAALSNKITKINSLYTDKADTEEIRYYITSINNVINIIKRNCNGDCIRYYTELNNLNSDTNKLVNNELLKIIRH